MEPAGGRVYRTQARNRDSNVPGFAALITLVAAHMLNVYPVTFSPLLPTAMHTNYFLVLHQLESLLYPTPIS